MVDILTKPFSPFLFLFLPSKLNDVESISNFQFLESVGAMETIFRRISICYAKRLI